MDEQNNVIETTKETFAPETVAEQNEEVRDDVFRLHEMRDALEASMSNISEVNIPISSEFSNE